jgi:hypothetical protein
MLGVEKEVVEKGRVEKERVGKERAGKGRVGEGRVEVVAHAPHSGCSRRHLGRSHLQVVW